MNLKEHRIVITRFTQGSGHKEVSLIKGSWATIDRCVPFQVKEIASVRLFANR